MKTRLMLGAMAVLNFMIAPLATACPDCNIHNFLESSLQSSTEIFIGKVLAQVDEQTARVEVLKVLRGNYKVHSKVKNKMYQAREDMGKVFIFSNPDSWPPTFDVLPLELEDEVLFLIQKTSSVDNIKEAIKRVQGISVKTQKAGLDYIEKHYDSAALPLIEEVKTLMPQVFASDNVFYGEYRLEQLVKALFLKPTKAGIDFAVLYIKNLPDQKVETINWKSIPFSPSSRGSFLKDLLYPAQKNKELSVPLNTQLLQVLPKLSGRGLAEAIYAIVLSQPNSVQSLRTTNKDEDSANMLALGLFWAGNYESNWWAHKKAYAFWEEALATVKQKQLKKAIRKEFEYSEGSIFKRDGKNADKIPNRME